MNDGSTAWQPTIGAIATPAGTRFRVWAPASARVEVVVYQDSGFGIRDSGGELAPEEVSEAFREVAAYPLEPQGEGWFGAEVQGMGVGARYRYRLDGGDAFPDPASRSQPDGVHAPSAVIDPGAFAWGDAAWAGRPLGELVIYELHVGTATPEGSFEALIPRLAELRALGVTALELMPVAAFPGARNWGYDGVYPYAPHAVYGGPEGLRRLVDAAHAHDLAVLLDVVYNHFGPEGNYLPALTGGKVFTAKHSSPWGAGINFDDEGSQAVRALFLENALHWLHEYHLDGLRLDATHAILDESEVHFLQELAARVRAQAPRPVVLIAEDERNERRVLLPPEQGGLGLDAVWADDFHHQVRRLAAGDREGYYAAYRGSAPDLTETLRRGWYYEGQVYPPHGEPRGTPSEGLPPERFVHCIQNHDQVGNRALGSRLNHDTSLAAFRAASALLLLSPYTPLLWMGQEWAASTPFLYFTDHPEELGRLVTQGRREEFKHFSQFADPALRERIPDPQAPETFARSRLVWEERERMPHAGVQRLYRELLALRAREPALRRRERASWQVTALSPGAVALRRTAEDGALLLVAGLAGELRVNPAERAETAPPSARPWAFVLASEEARFGGAGDWGRLEADGSLHLQGPGAVLLRGE